MPRDEKFARDYPDVVLDITTEDDSRRDLVAGRFDAGIHLGEFLQRDMVAVKVTGEQRAAIVAAPSYFDSHPKPKTPRAATSHRCIRYRMGTDGPVYRWEFEKRGRPVTVAVTGPLIVNDVELTIRAALDGVGLAFALEEHAARHIARAPAGTGTRGLVSSVRRLLPLLPEPPPPASGPSGAGRRDPSLNEPEAAFWRTPLTSFTSLTRPSGKGQDAFGGRPRRCRRRLREGAPMQTRDFTSLNVVALALALSVCLTAPAIGADALRAGAARVDVTPAGDRLLRRHTGKPAGRPAARRCGSASPRGLRSPAGSRVPRRDLLRRRRPDLVAEAAERSAPTRAARVAPLSSTMART